MKKTFWIAGVFATVILLIFIFGQWEKGPNSFLEIDKINPLDHIKGNASSTVVIIEYGDFQCLVSRSYYLLMRQVTQKYGNKIAFVYRHFPITDVHRNAEYAARASEAASQKGKFWEMHNLLFEKQNEWSEKSDPLPYFKNYAGLIGLSVDQFAKDVESLRIKNFVKVQKSRVRKLNLKKTPTFFINGKEIQAPQSFQDFKNVIDEELKKQKLF